jgi:hypothetical protein
VLAGTPIVVSAALADDHAGVRRDDEGHLWLAHWVADRPDRVAGTRLEGLGPAQIAGPGWAAVGARLPAGARAVEVRDDDGTWRPAAVAGGAWVAFAQRDDGAPGLPPVRVRDSEGGLVFRSDPQWLESARPLGDGERAALAVGGFGPSCPSCGADAWHAAPTDRGQGEHVFCAVCGENDGSVRAFFSATRPD